MDYEAGGILHLLVIVLGVGGFLFQIGQSDKVTFEQRPRQEGGSTAGIWRTVPAAGMVMQSPEAGLCLACVGGS